jgi:hypothetical protein
MLRAQANTCVPSSDADNILLPSVELGLHRMVQRICVSLGDVADWLGALHVMDFEDGLPETVEIPLSFSSHLICEGAKKLPPFAG